MEDEFGPAYARSLARQQALTAFGGRSVQEALDDGEEPREVWEAVCAQMDVPPQRRLGVDRPPLDPPPDV